jgi:hypothetical protein
MDENEKKTEAEAHYIEKVRRRAHAIWMDEGQVHGRDQEHWRQAESEIAAETSAPNAPKPEPVIPKPEKSPKAATAGSKITESPLRTGP